DHVLKMIDFGLRDPFGSKAHGKTLECTAPARQFLELVVVPNGDRITARAVAIDHAAAFETAKRLAQRRAADTKQIGDALLGDLGLDIKFTGKNQLRDLVINDIDKAGAWRRHDSLRLS